MAAGLFGHLGHHRVEVVRVALDDERMVAQRAVPVAGRLTRDGAAMQRSRYLSSCFRVTVQAVLIDELTVVPEFGVGIPELPVRLSAVAERHRDHAPDNRVIVGREAQHERVVAINLGARIATPAGESAPTAEVNGTDGTPFSDLFGNGGSNLDPDYDEDFTA